MATITRIRVQRNHGRFGGIDQSWIVEVGKDRSTRAWFARMVWRRYSTDDDGDSWAMWEWCDGGSRATWLLDPERDMATIDVLIAGLLPHLRAAGKTGQANKLRKRQEDYWQRAREARERAEALIAGSQ